MGSQRKGIRKTMKSYLLVGAGGTGTHLMRPLHAYLASMHKNEDWMLHIIDGDVVEEKNLERQLFPASALVMNKAEAAAAILQDAQHVTAHAVYLSENNIEKMIQNGDVVFICADNFTVRKRIEDRARELDNIVIINGGNEKEDGSVQLWVRENGEDITPRIGYLHPEIAIAKGADRAEMTCAQAAALPGGEQTLIANLTSATWMLTALWKFHAGHYGPAEAPSPKTWTELQFDIGKGIVEHIDQRLSSHWKTA